jgi:hypothetical protein
VYLTAADDVEQTRELPQGEVYTVLFGGAQGLPANVCDGIPFEDCTTATGLERALCVLRGSGVSYDDDRNPYVDGYYRDIVLIHDANGRCIAKLRALRAQVMMMRVAVREGVLPAPMLAAVNVLRADPGFGKRYRDLPAAVRVRLATQRWAGHDSEDDRTVDDEGTVMDGGLP